MRTLQLGRVFSAIYIIIVITIHLSGKRNETRKKTIIIYIVFCASEKSMVFFIAKVQYLYFLYLA